MHWMSDKIFFSWFWRSSRKTVGSSRKTNFFQAIIALISQEKDWHPSPHCSPNFWNWSENVPSFFLSGTFKKALKCTGCWTINLHQSSGEDKAVWKLTFFEATIVLILKEKDMKKKSSITFFGPNSKIIFKYQTTQDVLLN